MNCTGLERQTGFAEYIERLRNVTSNNITVAAMGGCQTQICVTLYGIGNADIAGIGVLVAYFMNIVLAVALATTVECTPKSWRRAQCISKAAFRAFSNGTILFGLAVQLATAIYVLKKGYGNNSSDFGGLTVTIAISAAILTILPLPVVCRSSLGHYRRQLQVGLVCIALILFLVVFLFYMAVEFAPSQIGSDSGIAVLSYEEFWQLELLCFQGASDMQGPARITATAFTIIAAISVSLAILVHLCVMFAETFEARWIASCKLWLKSKGFTQRLIMAALVVLVLVLACPQFWLIMYYRKKQRNLADSLDLEDHDNQWSFGQIIAVVVFLPVFIEGCFEWYWPEASTRQGTAGHRK